MLSNQLPPALAGGKRGLIFPDLAKQNPRSYIKHSIWAKANWCFAFIYEWADSY
jgi:hypothetical protein